MKLHKSEEHSLKVISREKRHGFKKGFSCSISHPVAFFQTVEELNEHVRNEHIEDNTEHSCETCSQNFCSTRVLDLHYVSEHEDQRFTCPQCLKVKLVSKESKHFGDIAGIFPQIRGHSNRFVLCTSI